MAKPRWGRSYRASIRVGKGISAHLGLYSSPWHAALAHGFASELLKKPRPPLRIPTDQEPNADEVRQIWERVRVRLGLVPPRQAAREQPPSAQEVLTLFEVTVIPFWGLEAESDHGDRPGAGLEAAASRLVEAARILFWARSVGHPSPLEAMTRLLSRRLELAFRRSDLTREVLDDEADDELGVARWLVYPNEAKGAHRGFVDEIRNLYADILDDGSAESGESRPAWAALLELEPPFDVDRVRSAFLAMSRRVHPDAGGSDDAFVQMRLAYEEGIEYCKSRRS